MELRLCLKRSTAILGLAALLPLSINSLSADEAAQPVSKLPRPDHVVIVIEENKSFDQIVALSVMVKTPAPYINSLANNGALFTNSYALTHPSQPNYLALFSGSTHDVRDDRCPLILTGPNLAAALRERGLSFITYSESMPSRGFDGCYYANNLYARKHNPAANWSNLASDTNIPFDFFPSDYSRLPTIALVVPNQLNDMHDGRTLEEAIARGDAWLKDKIDPYIRWARSNNSLFILTWDEDDGSGNNRVATIFVGPMVRSGRYEAHINHYSILRTLTEMYGLPPLGNAASSNPITQVWKAKP